MTSSPRKDTQQPSYPLPAYLDFVPGGVEYGANQPKSENWYGLNYIAPDALVQKAFIADKILHKYAIRSEYQSMAVTQKGKGKGSHMNIKLEEMQLSEDTAATLESIPHRLASLSVLAEMAFAPLTGVHSTQVKKWADAMIMKYLQDADLSKESTSASSSESASESAFKIQNILRQTEQQLVEEFESSTASIPSPPPSKSTSSASTPTHQNELVHSLKKLHKKTVQGGSICLPIRQCGYVFQNGDIAWNCRTCQYDNTCVLCDECFQASDHVGHEVTFHKTSPGGCCDCGDQEAWKAEGCCPLHRPKDSRVGLKDTDVNEDSNVENNANEIGSNGGIKAGDEVVSGSLVDNLEAFKVSLKGRMDGETFVKELLSKELAAALGVVIGAAVNTVVQAVDGAGIGADPVQWTRRWADQKRRIHDGRSVDEEYFLGKKSCVATVGEAIKLPSPNRFRLHLRLHNDDVHTYDEVIEALWPGSYSRSARRPDDLRDELDTSLGLVQDKETAIEKTQLVDSDGQVIVRDYITVEGAQAGYNRLKAGGLHCSVISTPQVELENRARMLLSWLAEIASAHPAVSAIVVHALVDVTDGNDSLGGALVWGSSKMVPVWSFSESYLSSARVSIREDEEDDPSVPGWRRRMDVFPPHLSSTYLSREEYRQLYKLGFGSSHDLSSPSKGVDFDFYTKVPYHLQSERFMKSPHSLWGVMPSPFTKSKKYSHPILSRDTAASSQSHHLLDRLIVLDTDLRKQQEADKFSSEAYTHKLLGLHMISGVGLVDIDGDKNGGSYMKPTAEDWRRLLSISSYRAPTSPLLLLLLLDPYPTKQLRATIHQLFLSIFIDSRLKARFAASLGGIAYRPLTTLFCAGIGTDADTILHFTVQIFTAGSIVRALCDSDTTQKLLSADDGSEGDESNGRGVFCLPLAHNIVRCIHTNLLGACEEVRMVLKHTDAGHLLSHGDRESQSKSKALAGLVYQQGEQPINTLLPAAPDDGFLDSRSTKHKRLPHLLRDLEYVLETPDTSMRLLRPRDTVNGTPSPNEFASIWCRLLRLAQGMDPQKRKISGGHVEFEQLRWLEAFSLSLHFAGARDKLAESLPNSTNVDPPALGEMREGMGNLFTALLREMKCWLYREGVLDAFPSSSIGSSKNADKMDALQRSTLHVSTTSLGVASIPSEDGNKTPAFSCATQIKMTESHLDIIETAIRIEQSQHCLSGAGRGTIAGDWLRVPHSPHGGDYLSFHLPLHRSFARNVLSTCSLAISDNVRSSKPFSWWQLPVLDDDNVADSAEESLDHPLCKLLRSTLRSSNCRITWSAGPDCTSEEAQMRRSRSRAISSAVAAAKVIHSLCDHPLRCLAAAEQIRRHLWNRNGSTAAGMSLNYGTTPLCRSFRDLDLTMVQLSASGFSIGLGARRVFSLLLSRFDMEGFLCDLERRAGNKSPTNTDKSIGSIDWVMPKRLQDPEHAQVLMDAFFATLCIIVTELPSPPPLSTSDNSSMKAKIRRELLHALSTNALTYSKAIAAASIAVSRRDEHSSSSSLDGDSESFREVFESVLREISEQKSKGTRGAPTFELKQDVSDEYDPSFYHLKGSEHQQAMDNIARLRKLKSSGHRKGSCLPIVGAPPMAHPRFVPCRMLLHLPSLDAAIRRGLMFALTGGRWLPPSAPSEIEDDLTTLSNPSFASDISGPDGKTIKVNSRRKARAEQSREAPFSEKTVNTASHSFLEVLQLLTLQVHTLEECACMHRSHLCLDYENKVSSSSLSINTYLGRLVHIPSSLVDVWAFKSFPEGPIPSKGSGLNKASLLGLLIALYEHRSDHGIGAGGESGHGDEENDGARHLVADGLKWLLRFVSALVDGAESVGQAHRSAIDGVKLKRSRKADATLWTIDEHLQSFVSGMLDNLQDLWPNEEAATSPSGQDKVSEKNRQARKAAQMRILERMKKQQESFAASMGGDEKGNAGDSSNVDEEADLCIICRCDDEDGENNGPLGYLGHVQRSRNLQLRSQTEHCGASHKLVHAYRVVGDKGCQLRKDESLDSIPVACVSAGSIVEAKELCISPKYDLRTRRIFVRHASPDDAKVVEGWASVQSTQGYIILSPIIDLCYNNSRWGSTRPLIRQCGHAAHLGCVDTHIASIHQKSQAETPYDGRFAADIEDGEFLCPLCKQLCNIVVPAETLSSPTMEDEQMTPPASATSTVQEVLDTLHRSLSFQQNKACPEREARRAINQYGNYLEHSMQVFSWDPEHGRKGKAQKHWHKALKNWDFREDEEDSISSSDNNHLISDILRLLRQQHIAWAAAGYAAAAAEASQRGVQKAGFEPPTSDPWPDFDSSSKDTHTMVIELRRTMAAASSLHNLLGERINEKLEEKEDSSSASIVGYLLGNILRGEFWSSGEDVDSDVLDNWKVLTALLTSLPCHVSKDESLSLRHEARAVSAQIWAVNAGPCVIESGSDTESALPPPPLSVRKVPDCDKLKTGWGSMVPSEVMNKKLLPFRPALATGFLYLPLLSWDLTTLSGAVFSSLLSSENVQIQDLHHIARILLVGRMIQVLVTLNDRQSVEAMESPHFEADIDVSKESAAIADLLHCLQSGNTKATEHEDKFDKNVLAYVSHGILPFARTLLLILRASTSALRLRGKDSTDALDSLLESEDAMYIEDGIYFMKELGCPLPSELLSGFFQTSESDPCFQWGELIKRWLIAVTTLDAYQGSRGNHVVYDDENKTWIPAVVKINRNARRVDLEKDAEELIEQVMEMSAESLQDEVGSDDDDDDDNDDDNADIMEEEDEESDDEDGPWRGFEVGDNALDLDGDASSDEEMEHVDGGMFEDEIDILGLPSLPSQLEDSMLDVTDVSVCSVYSWDQLEDVSPSNRSNHQALEKLYAGISTSAIIPYQPSVIGLKEPGPGPRGGSLHSSASQIMLDTSHLGLSHCSVNASQGSGLIRLPHSFVELYSLVNQVKRVGRKNGHQDSDDSGSGEIAICLITGTIIHSGSQKRYRSGRRAIRAPGACTTHARKYGSGTGIFFLSQKCTVLIVHNKKQAYWASLYVDENGEEDQNLSRGRPLFLNKERYEALSSLWRQHGVPGEVAQIRSTSDRVIRDNWY